MDDLRTNLLDEHWKPLAFAVWDLRATGSSDEVILAAVHRFLEQRTEPEPEPHAGA